MYPDEYQERYDAALEKHIERCPDCKALEENRKPADCDDEDWAVMMEDREARQAECFNNACEAAYDHAIDQKLQELRGK